MFFLSSSIFDDIDLSVTGTVVMMAIIGVMALAAAAVNLVPRLVRKWEVEYKTRDLTYGAVCLAIAFALSWARLFRMPAGGSVTPAALAPIFIYCYYFGLRKGMIITIAFALLQFLQGPYIVSPWSAFFDYLLPYFSLCVVGIFCYKPHKYADFVKKHKSMKDAKSAAKYWAYTVAGHWGLFVGAVLHMLIRYFSSCISSVLFFAYGAPPAEAFVAGLVYNTYALVDSAIAIAACLVLVSSRTFNMYMSVAFGSKKAALEASESSDGLASAETPAAAEEAPAEHTEIAPDERENL